MSTINSAAALAAMAALVVPLSAQAFTGPGGCNGLPEYYRALGTLQGNMESACNMTVEQAARIVAAYDHPGYVEQPAPQVPRSRYHRRAAQQVR